LRGERFSQRRGRPAIRRAHLGACRTDDVGEEHRRKDAVRASTAAEPGEELLDEANHPLLPLREVLALVAWQQLEARVCNAVGEPPALRHGNGGMLEMQDEGGTRHE